MTVPLVITVRQAMQLAPIGKTKLYQLMKTGRLKSTVVFDRRLIDYRSFVELILPTNLPTNLSQAEGNVGERTRTATTEKRPKIKGNPARSERTRTYPNGG